MSFIIKIEKYAFIVLIVGLIGSILSTLNILPFEVRYVVLILSILLAFYYFPVLPFVKNFSTGHHEKKEKIFAVLSGFLFMQTCSFLAIVQILPIEPILLFGQIVAVIHGLAFLFFLIMGQPYRTLFIRHFLTHSLIIFVVILMKPI